jgi:small subunit ribosomal protein S21
MPDCASVVQRSVRASELISHREHTSVCFDEYRLIGEVSSDLAHVTLKPNESQDSLLRRFRKKVTRERILSDAKKKRFFMKKSAERRRAHRKAVRKEQQRLRRERRQRY